MVLWLIAAVLILALKLHTKLLYRLNLYQIISIVFLLVIFEVYFTNRIRWCATVCQFTLKTALIFALGAYQFLSTWTVLHLFALAVCHKNLNKLEPLYVGSSVLIPSVLAAVTFALSFIETFSTFKHNGHTYIIQLLIRLKE